MKPQRLKSFYTLWLAVSIHCSLFATGKHVNDTTHRVVDTTFSTAMNQVFGHLDATKIPNGILRDYGMEFTNLENYNGVTLADSNLLCKRSFFEIYNTLALSSITSAAHTAVPTPDAVDSTMIALSVPGKVTLGGLFYQYGYFSADAVSGGKITVTNNQLYDKYVGGVYQNPYLQDRVVAFAPSYDTYQGKNFNLNLPAALWLSNSKTIVNHIEVDAADGLGYRTITPGTNLPVSYSDTGMRVLNFKVYLTDNSVLLSHTQLHVVPDPMATIIIGGPNPVLPASHGFTQFQLPGIVFTNIYQGTSTASYQGKAATGFITIRYAHGHSALVKPLIVVEGFDPGIYTHPTNMSGDFSINNFLGNAEANYTFDSLLEGSTSQYDIVFVDFHDGTDDMHRNALLVEDVIRWVNASKTGTLPNVVLGLSMGGVISRYALKKMEQAGETHQVRLFINDGGPQLGAVVPLGYQYMVNHGASLYAKSGLNGITQFVRLLFPQFPNYHGILSLTDCPAAKQMLIYRINQNFQMDNSVHTAWQSELNTLGYPTQSRNVAVSNGSECGTPQDLSVGGQLLYVDGKIKNSLFADLVTSGLSLSLAPTPQQISTSLLAGVPGRNDVLLHFEAYGSADGGGNLVYHGKVTYKKTILFLIPVSVTLTDKSFNAPSGTLALESYEGDRYVFDSPLASTNGPQKGISAVLFKYNITATQLPDFGFIPTPSALDIGQGSVALTKTDYQASYTGANPPQPPNKVSPFNNFVTGHNSTATNEQHITYDDPHISNWIALELTGPTTTLGCTLLCGLNTITGDENNCNNIKPYSAPSIPGASYYWTVLHNRLIVISGQGTSTVQVQPQTGTNGTRDTLVVTISLHDCQATINKPIVIGLETLTVNATVDRTVQANHYQYLSATASQLGNTTSSNYTWYQEVNNQPTTVIGTGLTLNHYPMAPGTTLYYRLQVSTACGIDIYRSYAYNDYHGTSALAKTITIYPNPSDKFMTVTDNDIQEDNSNSSLTQNFEARLYDDKGKVLCSAKNVNGARSVTLPIGDIPSGIYFIHVIHGEKVIMKSVLITH